MALDDVTISQHQDTFTLRVDGEPCYGETCAGCCGSADTFLTRDELETLSDRILDALDPARHDTATPHMTEQDYLGRTEQN